MIDPDYVPTAWMDTNGVVEMKIDAKQIPEEASKAVYDLFEPGYLESIGLHPESIAAAALNAWPGATDSDLTFEGRTTSVFILPLPQDTSDE
jgi:hypothetical protein